MCGFRSLTVPSGYLRISYPPLVELIFIFNKKSFSYENSQIQSLYKQPKWRILLQMP